MPLYVKRILLKETLFIVKRLDLESFQIVRLSLFIQYLQLFVKFFNLVIALVKLDLLVDLVVDLSLGNQE